MCGPFSPLFGEYHPADMGALKAEAVEAVSMTFETIDGFDLTLEVPPILQPDVKIYGSINTTTNTEDYYAFDAFEGTMFAIELTRNGADNACITLLDRNGSEEQIIKQSWESQIIYWNSSVDGRYYVKVSDPEWNRTGGNYSIICYSAGYYNPESDISGRQWSGVKDGQVDCMDFAMLSSYWLESCEAPYWVRRQ